MLYVGSGPISPGSYLHPAPFQWWPEDLSRLPLSIGLTMVGYSGHAVFPSVYKSMQDPKKYAKAVDIAYVNVFSLYAILAVVGYLMYGMDTQKEITLNFNSSGTGGHWIMTAVTWVVALNPLTKYALALSPVTESLESHLIPATLLLGDSSNWGLKLWRVSIRTIVSAMTLGVALAVPNFARVTALLGSLFAIIVSVIFPIVAYMKIFNCSLTTSEKLWNGALLVLSIILGALGTFSSFFAPTD